MLWFELMEKRRNLLGAGIEEITECLGPDTAAYRPSQIFAGIYRRRYQDWNSFTDLGKSLRASLRERFAIEYPVAHASFLSRDGTRRYLFSVPPNHAIETIFIPEEKRDTICLSTQVGCAVDCLFCVTGRLSTRRDLTAGEIIGQILVLQTDRDNSLKRLNIVIMGMGEPLLNYDNVTRALRLMTDARGMAISPRRITLSTSGIVPALKRLAQEPIVPNLAISLNATTDRVRDLLIPINRKWNIASLMETCRNFPQEKRRRITIEYVLIEGVNDTDEDARRLAGLLKGLQRRVNLIPLNPDPWIPLNPPPMDRILEFQEILKRRRVRAYIRRPRGNDISAACGTLAGRKAPSGDSLNPPPKPANVKALLQLR